MRFYNITMNLLCWFGLVFTLVFVKQLFLEPVLAPGADGIWLGCIAAFLSYQLGIMPNQRALSLHNRGFGMNTKRLIELLDGHVTQGYVRKIPNPWFDDLFIYDYDMKAQFEKFWPEEVRMARGLVINTKREEIVARPMPKFFNLGELPECQAQNLPDETPELAEKMDGSLIIVWKNSANDFWRASTRGSFNSQQATEANRWLKQNAEDLERRGFLKPGWTYMFEYVGPENQIVVFYPKPSFNFITRIHNQTGRDISYEQAFDEAMEFDLNGIYFERKRVTAVDLHDMNVKNKEGYVARFSNGYRVKLKYQQYMLLHRIATGMSEKAIWEGLATGYRKFDLSNIPDEFQEWYNKKVWVFKDSWNEIYEEAYAFIEKNVGEDIKPPANRKDPAWRKFKSELAKQTTGLSPLVRCVVFAMIEGHNYSKIIWDALEPKNGKTMFQEINITKENS